jgi:hypothetical protein
MACLLAALLASCGSGSQQARPAIVVPAPAPGPPRVEPALPDSPTSTLTAALEIELETVRARIDASLPLAREQDWMRVTREGASPRIELRYFLERDPVQLSFARGALRTEIPLRYWADVRGAVESPLPWHENRWFELDRDQSWGTRAQPQRATVVVTTRVQLDAQGRLRVDSRVDPIDPGAPPPGSFCVKAGIRLCVGKETFAGEVRGAFEQRIAPALRDAVAALDRELERELDVRAALARGWQQLQCPWALHRGAALSCRPEPGEQGLWLQVTPERLIANEPSRRGKRLRLLVSLWATLSVSSGTPPGAGSAPLPPIDTRERAIDPVATLHVPVALPYDLLSSQLALALPSGNLALGSAGQAKLVAVRVVGASAEGARPRLLLELRLRGAVDALFYAYARVQAASSVVHLVDLEYSAESERTLTAALPDADHAALRRALARALHVELTPIGALLAQSLPAALAQDERAPALGIEVSRVTLSYPRLGGQSLRALLSVAGTIRVHVPPAALDPGAR